MIASPILLEAGAVEVSFRKGEWIFRQGGQARYYFQIVEGQVKMSNFSAQGQEFVQGLFAAGQSFGEPPLLTDLTYPASAIASTDCRVYKLNKDKFLNILLANPKISLEVGKSLAKRLHYKATMASEISSNHPEHRILTLLTYLKNEIHPNTNDLHPVDLTRQQIADMTGLRVETVIRSIKKMEKEKQLVIQNRKVYL
ncbi:MAG: Crp/Fnr family transcriptional regulator [Reichenbachiella sp.]|uniref:Crp/Fnr family transcriptional regulator n=1 Tax=Reichenbachiella sp. TaxID=2184521 RepID=UPI0032676AA0